MKAYTIKLIATGILTAMIAGCATTEQESVVQDRAKGMNVIEKNVQNMTPMPHSNTSGAGCYEIFSSLRDDIKPSCSLLFIKVKPGEELIKHSITNDMIIYVVKGGGNLTVDKHAYIMSPGESIYVPGGKSRHVLNNSKKILEFLMYITPTYKPADITILQEQKPAVLSAQAIRDKQNKAIAKKVLGKDAQKIGKESVKNIQELTPKEGKKPSSPPDATLL